jgi:sugar/nucleoside kinase (ribokinase family)
MPDIVTVGEILVEIMTKEINQTFLQPGELVGPYPSGALAIFADQTARMGGSVGIVSAIGCDDFGKMNIKRLEMDGVDISKVKTIKDKTTGTAFVTYFDNSERQFIFHFSDSAGGQIELTESDEKYIKNARYLHIMGCSIAASETNRNAIHKALKIAVENNLTISFDPNIRPELLNNNKINNVFEDILNHANIILTGKSEICNIAYESDFEFAVKKINKKNVKIIVIKNGKEPVRAYYNGEIIEYKTVCEFKAIDATGAGDCFDGAFIAALSQNLSVSQSLKYATEAGNLSVTKKGPMEGACYKKDIEEFYNKYK